MVGDKNVLTIRRSIFYGRNRKSSEKETKASSKVYREKRYNEP